MPDLVGGPGDPPTRLLFVGINPGLWTAAAGAHFARRGNRFWPALHLAGITPRLIDASGGMSADDLREVRQLGIGITNIVPVATARADELSAAELAAGGERLVALVHELRPAVVAVLGITAFRQALRAPATSVGRQPASDGRVGAVGAAQSQRPERARDRAHVGCRLSRGGHRRRRGHWLMAETRWQGTGCRATLGR